MRFILLALLILTLSSIASATTLEGKVYDFSLAAVDKAIVEINTTPIQRAVTENGTYLFELEGGDYTLTARSMAQGVVVAQAQEQVLLPDEGRFMLDLILFPEIMEDIDVVQPEDEIKDIFERPADEYFFIYRALFIIGVALAAWGGYTWYQRRSTNETQNDNDHQAPAAKDINALLAIIKQHEGRITQKDLRKELPYSEAKVSLMLDELESQDKLKRIKKGRGNIIVLK